MRGSRVWPFVVVAALACQAQEEQPRNLGIWRDPGGELALHQPNPSVLVAMDARTGQVRWRYHPVFERRAPYGLLPARKLACDAEWTPSGKVVAVYDHAIHVLDGATGGLKWQASRSRDRYCPAVTPDSGIVTIHRPGTRLVKLDSSGARRWTYELPDAATAVAKPTVLFPTGDIIVRTRHRLLSVNPGGKLNWNVPLETK